MNTVKRLLIQKYTPMIGMLYPMNARKNVWNIGKMKFPNCKNPSKEELKSFKEEENTMSKVELSKERVKHIVFRILQNAERALFYKSDNKGGEYAAGLADGYYEVLSTIQSELTFADQDLSEFGLDIDLEKTFL